MKLLYFKSHIPANSYSTFLTERCVKIQNSLAFNSPEALLDDDCSISTLLKPFVLFVGAVLVLDDRGRLATSLEALLGVVGPELTLNEDCRLGHLLVIRVLKDGK